MTQLLLRKEFDFSSKEEKHFPEKMEQQKNEVSSILIKGVLISGALASILIIDKNNPFKDTYANNKIYNSNETSYPTINSAKNNQSNEKDGLFIKSFTGGNILTLTNTIDLDNIKGKLLTSIVQNPRKVHKQLSAPTDIMEKSAVIGGTDTMYERLIEKRNTFEKKSIATGLTVAAISSLVPIITGIKFSAIAPAPLLFLSLSGFMILRRSLRRDGSVK